MKIRRSTLAALAAVTGGVLAGCASAPTQEAQAQAAEIKVYRMTELAGSRVEVVSHLWADSWTSSFWSPTYARQDDAIASLRAEAARLGADALVNVVCLDQGHPQWSQSAEPAILCYGSAVHVRRGEG